jgi:hypothetical protein
MSGTESRINRGWAITTFLGGTLVFALVYCQAPLYYSNQNQYFLHGLAEAGFGSLDEDWLANTADPTPVFSFLVAATYRFLHPFLFYLYYGLLFGVYFTTMVGLFSLLAGERATVRLRIAFIAGLLLVHSALGRWCSYRLLGSDYPWFFQAGVAGQYVLGAMFQPSTFGVLLILSIYLFARDRPYGAVASACLAAIVHSTYLLGAGLLTLAYLGVLVRERRTRQALLLGFLAFMLVLPVTLYVLIVFRPTSAQVFAKSQDLLVHFRIPHHTLPHLWWDGIAAGQVAWVLLSIYLVRGSRLFAVLLVVFLFSLGLTLLQVATDSDTLALLFPWRTSSVLVPVATTIILSRLVLAGARWLDNTWATTINALTVAGLVASGLVITYFRLGFQASDDELPLLEYVQAHQSAGDVYLLPVQVPNLKVTTRGALSSDFKPLAAKRQDARVIPVDLQRFRLSTGTPIFVDFKSVPYKDTDVLEWHARLLWTRDFYKDLRAGKLGPAKEGLRQRHITHIVTTADLEVKDHELLMVHEDAAYRVYRLVEARPTLGPGAR